MNARRRETSITHAVYEYHPRFVGTATAYDPWLEPLEGGDVLLLAPGVVAVGVGERTTPAGAERLARALFWPPEKDAEPLAHTVLAVPIAFYRRRGPLSLPARVVGVLFFAVVWGMLGYLFFVVVQMFFEGW